MLIDTKMKEYLKLKNMHYELWVRNQVQDKLGTHMGLGIARDIGGLEMRIDKLGYGVLRTKKKV